MLILMLACYDSGTRDFLRKQGIGENMKKAASMILLLMVLVSMASCGKQTQESASSDYSGNATASEYTEELVVYFLPVIVRAFFDKTVEIFEREYPNVNLIVEEFDLTYSDPVDLASLVQKQEQVKTRLLTELLAGTGPDIIVWSGNVPFGDLEKVMGIDVFEDLNPYFAADESFNYDDFISGVFNAGLRDSKRLFVPISYLVPYKFTTAEAMNHYNVSFTKDMDFEHYAKEFKKVYEQIEMDDSRWFGYENDDLVIYLNTLAGLQYIEYEKEEVCIDSAVFKTFLDVYSPFIRLTKDRANRSVFPPIFVMGFENRMLNGKQLELQCDIVVLDNLIANFKMIFESGQTPTIYAIPRIGGGKTAASPSNNAAIGKNSKNKANAYDFLKFLLSEEAYVQESTLFTPFSVRKGSTERRLKRDTEKYIQERHLETWNQVSKDYLSIVTDVEMVFVSSDVINMVNDSMMPYVLGEKAYDECFAELEKKLRFYISE